MSSSWIHSGPYFVFRSSNHRPRKGTFLYGRSALSTFKGISLDAQKAIHTDFVTAMKLHSNVATKTSGKVI